MTASLQNAAVRDLIELIGLARSSYESNLGLVERQEDLYTRLGWDCRRFAVPDDGPGRFNLMVSRGDPKVLFCVHSDTVPPGKPTLWASTGGKPRRAVYWDGKVWGLGASDSLGCAAVLDVLAQAHRLPEGTAIVFTADEEVGAIGASHLVRAGGVPSSVEMVVIGEPTDNKVVRGHKGYVPFDIVARGVVQTDAPGEVPESEVRAIVVIGQESHSARPAEGRNALFEAAHLEDVHAVADQVVLSLECGGVRNKVPGHVVVKWAARHAPQGTGFHTRIDLMPALGFLETMEELAERTARTTDARFRPPEVTLNVGAVAMQGRDLVFACDLRPVPGFDAQAVLEESLALARKRFGDAVLRRPHEPLQPVWNDLDPTTDKALADLLDEHGKSAYTEAAVFDRAGFPCIIAGPGNLKVHRPNEYVDAAALAKGGTVYRRIAALVTGNHA